MSIQSMERRLLQRLTVPLWVAVANVMTKDVKKRRMTAETKRDMVIDLEGVGTLGTEIH